MEENMRGIKLGVYTDAVEGDNKSGGIYLTAPS